MQVLDVEAAHRALPSGLRDTPQYVDAGLTRELGREVTLKFECFNPVRSFKARGAHTLLATVPDGAHLVCGSAGNFGQGLALAARGREVTLTVYAATTATPGKLARIRELGAELVCVGEDYDEAKTAARAAAADLDALWIEDGDNEPVALGAATIGLELADLDLDTVLVPVGNGALVTGIASVLSVRSPRTRVVGVCAQGAPAMLHSWQEDRVVTYSAIDTVAEGIGVRVPIPDAVLATRALVHDMLAVDDHALLGALRCLHQHVGVLVEPAAAAGLAALRSHPDRIPDDRVATVVTGANYTPDTARDVLHPA